MLPKNVFQQVRKNEEEKETEQINQPARERTQTTSNIRPPFASQPAQPPGIRPPIASRNINPEQQSSRTSQTGSDNSNDTQEFKRRSGYFTYNLETIVKVKKYMEAIDFENILVAFPLTYLITRKNKMSVQMTSILPGNLIFNSEQLKSSIPEKIFEQINENALQYNTKINLTMLNYASNPRQRKLLEQNGIFGLNNLVMYEFIPVFRDILFLYATGKIKDYQVPMYLPAPIGLFATKNNDIFDTVDMELRLCGNYLTYLHYNSEDDLLYFVLNEINVDCKNGYSDMLRGMMIFIPVEKLSAMFLSSSLKDF
jgi:hypothetical protein